MTSHSSATTPHSLSTGPIITLAAFATLLSGIAGLAYQVVWSRMLVLPLGNSKDATTLVLCAFMLGMAIGARLIGTVADKIKAPMRLYVAAELLLGVYAALLPLIIPALESSQAFTGNFESTPWKAMFRFAAASLLVLGPAILMGGSVPVLVRALSSVARDIRHRMGIFYGVNTLGGAIGAAGSGFLTIPAIGLAKTSYLAAALSIAAGIVVFLIHKAYSARLEFSLETPLEPYEKQVSLSPFMRYLVLAVAAVGGFVMLGAEVLWARLLTFVFGHDTYAFSILLVVVLVGLGTGGLLHRLWSRFNQVRVAGMALLGIGVTTFGSYQFSAWLVTTYGRDPFGIASMESLSASMWTEFIRQLTFAPILVLLPSLCAGISLPAAASALSYRPRRAGGDIGNALLINGIGAALGALITGVALIPAIGMANTFVSLCLLTVLLGFVVAFQDTSRAVRVVAVGAMTLLTSLFVLCPANPPKRMLQEAVGVHHQDIVHYEEGRIGTVSVTVNQINQERQLFINAVNEVTTRLVHDQSFKLLGHLAPLLHPKPESGLMICFGAGLSAGGAIVHPLDSLDIVDLSDAVWRAAPYFSRENNNVLRDSRVRPHVDDGRQFLLRSNELYDVVMIDSTHPKAVDSWILYTKGFYELARNHLHEEGILVQWLPLHGLSETEFQIIVKTFWSVFPEMTMWANVGFEVYGKAAYVKLVGTHAPLEIDYRELTRRLKEPRIKRDLKAFGMDHPHEILDNFLADSTTVAQWIRDVPIQTDDHPFVSYITPYSRGRRMDAAALIPVRSSVIPLLYNMGEAEADVRQWWKRAFDANGFLMAGMLERAADIRPEGKKIQLSQQRFATGRQYYLELASKYATHWKKLFEIGNYLGNQGYPTDAVALYDQALALSPEHSLIEINKALALLDMGEGESALNLLAGVARRDPDSPLANYNYGVGLLATGDAKAAMPFLSRALRLNPRMEGANLALANAQRQSGLLAKAKGRLLGITARRPWQEEAWELLGLVEMDMGQYERARQNLAESLNLNPYRADVYYNLGIALEKLTRIRDAELAYRTALAIAPQDPDALNNLGLLLGKNGRYDEAIDHHKKALEIDPLFPQAAFNLALAYRANGNDLQAVTMLTLALEIDPTLEDARLLLADMDGAKDAARDTDTDTDTDADTPMDTDAASVK